MDADVIHSPQVRAPLNWTSCYST